MTTPALSQSSPRKPKRTGPRPSTGSPRKRLITVEDIETFQIPGDPQVSPDGSRVLFTHQQVGPKNKVHRNLWITNTHIPSPRPFTGGNKDSHGRWSPDGRTVAFIGERETHKPQIFLIPANGGEARPLTAFPEGRIGTFAWSPDGRWLAVSFREQAPEWTEAQKERRKQEGLSSPPLVIDDWWYRLDGDGYFGAQRYHLHLVDAASGRHQKIFDQDTLGFFTFDFSPDSTRLVIAANRHPKAMTRPWMDQLFQFNIRSRKLTRIPNVPPGAKTAVTWSPDGRHIAWAGHDGPDPVYSTENLHLYVCDAKSGATTILTNNADYCLLAIALSDCSEAEFDARIQWSRDSQRIYATIGWRGESHIASIPVSGGNLLFHTSGPCVHQMGNLSKNGSVMALARCDATHIDEVYLGFVTARGPMRLRPLTRLNKPLLDSLELSQPEMHWVTAADGARTQVWVITPPAPPQKKKPNGTLPAILEIHGGPHAQYGVGFFHEFQLLAAQGYVVVFSNPRGSKGYGRDHCAAIRGSWGGKDWEDIQAVIRFMKTHPRINPGRMGVMGGSYGGYMTNWVIGHAHDFAAAITDRCVSNLVSMFGTSDFTETPDRYWPGNPWDRPERLWERSPIRCLGNAKTPTLIIHSEGDLRCNVEQAEQVFTILKLNNVPTRFVRYPRETSHGLSRSGPPDLRAHRLRQIVAWWKQWLGPRQAPNLPNPGRRRLAGRKGIHQNQG